MEHLEKKLQQQLSQESLREPTAAVDDVVLELINKSDLQSRPLAVKRKVAWVPLSIAASFLVVAVYMSSQFGDLSNDANPRSELDLAFESSKQLEQSISQLEKSSISPAVFMEINRLNSQIANIDKDLQLVLSENFDNSKVVSLMNERIEKLSMVKSLYDSNSDLLRI
ncbi:MAG: hypothetical protein HWE16_16580 [Gammaproteobacteria bacterium]|nr:hypothetical protein [Gammaproteobacteria bacterium]